MRCISATRVFLGGKSRKNWRGQCRRRQKLVYFRNLFSSILSIRICDRSAQSLVNCFEKIVMATKNSRSNSNYMFACKWRATGKRKKRKGREQELMGEELERRGFKWKIYAACETCLLITEADRVLCHRVIFLHVFLHWIYKMKYSCYQHSFCYSWLACLLGCGREMHCSTKRNRKSSFSKIKVTLSKLTSPCWTMRKILLGDSGLTWCMGFRAASRPASFSNYIAFDVFFLVSWLCRHFTHICKIWDNLIYLS